VTNHDEDLLSDLLLQWEELYERGQDTPADKLCGSNRNLVDELSQRIAALKATHWLNNPNPRPTDESSNDTQAAGSRPSRVLMNRYRLDQLIAEGGFAQVWRAYDTELQRIVAVKIPKPSRLESTDSFLAEARRVARLKHPGIVPVHDVGVENGTCFIVSEYVEEGSLGDQLSKFPPTPEQAVRWITEIADALEYAHLHGVIHRDIKPANILIDHHGRALLADFGIAQSANKTGGFAPSLGTLRYMAPEQLDGQSATPASDVFSLGLVLHEALAGKLPYSSDSLSVVRREIAQGLHKAVSHTIPVPLRPVCEKALNRDPQQRHTSATHFCTDLKTAWKKKPRRNPWWWWIVLTPVIFLLACVIIGFVLLSLIRSHAEVVRKQTEERIDRDMRGTPAPEDLNTVQDRLYEQGGLVDSIRKMTEELGKDPAKKTADEGKPDSSQ
jgi:serine/threonine protein kinase